MAFQKLRSLFGIPEAGRRRRSQRQRALSVERLEDRQLLALIGVVPQFPIIVYDSTGQIDYNAASKAFDLKATPLTFKETPASPTRTIGSPRDLQIHIQVANNGQLIGGVPGHDLVLTGTIDINGDSIPDVSGTLLTGEILQFGYLNVGTTDRYDFRFTPTGGALQSYFLGKDIAVTTTSENSTFNGSFTTNFHGGAKGNIGTTPSNTIIITPDKSANCEPYVMLIDKVTGIPVRKFLAYEPGYRGGVRVTTGDLTGDGIAEIITAPGRSHVPEVRVFQQNGLELTQFRFLAYAPTFIGGVEIAVGDIDGDGKKDIVTAPSNGVSQINVFRNLYNPANPSADPIADAPYRSFMAFPASFIGGAVVEAADMGTFAGGTTVNPLALDGKAEIIVGNGPAMRSTIKVFDASAAVPVAVRTFLPFDAAFRGGVDIDVIKVNTLDLIPDLIVGAGTGGQSRVQVLDGRAGSVLSNFYAYTDNSRRAPLRVAGLDSNGDGVADSILTAQGTDGKTRQIRNFNLMGALVDTIYANDPVFGGMYNLAAVRR